VRIVKQREAVVLAGTVAWNIHNYIYTIHTQGFVYCFWPSLA